MLAYLPQNLSFPNEELTVLDYFREDINILEGKAREFLAKFLFYGGNVYKKIKHLSGGEKIRLKLSKLLFEGVNLLILDEPTNHLDTVSIESIEEALSDFKGTIFLISHDRYFINKIAQRVISIEDNTFKSYLGNYDYYKSIKNAEAEQEMMQSKDSIELLSNGKQKEERKSLKNKGKQQVSGNDTISKVKQQKVQNDTDRKEKQWVEREASTSHADPSRNSILYKKGNNSKNPSKVEERVNALEEMIKDIENAMEESIDNCEELNRLYLRKEELTLQLENEMDTWLRVSEKM
jgi:ABC-type multidrug transport system ATPase subunit